MNKYLFFFILLLIPAFIYSQDILNNNEYYKKAIELLEKAKTEFENGDYDAGYKYSEEAKENIGKATDYFLMQITVLKIESVKKSVAELDNEINKAGFTETNAKYNDYNNIKKSIEEADNYFIQAETKATFKEKSDIYLQSFEKYTECETKLNDILIYLKSADFSKKEQIYEIKETKTEIKEPIIEKKAVINEIKETEKASVENSFKYDQRKEAQELLEIAKKELIKELKTGAGKYYKKELKKINEFIQFASDNFKNEKYPESISISKQAIEMINTFDYNNLKLEIFPRYYKVQDYSETKDCLWKIAEEKFVYNDPLKWIVLFDENKKRLINPDDPNVILKWKLIEIPSLNGEIREGIYNPKNKYPVFDHSKNYKN